LNGRPQELLYRSLINRVETAAAQLGLVDRFVDAHANGGESTLAAAA
jgi:hypothetical protein